MLACAIGYHADNIHNFDAQRLTNIIKQWVPLLGITGVVVGNWPGIDQCLAQAARELKLPMDVYESYRRTEPEGKRKLFNRICIESRAYAQLATEASPEAVAIGHHYRMRHSDIVLTFWDGEEGETADAIAWAEGTPRTVIHFWKPYYA